MTITGREQPRGLAARPQPPICAGRFKHGARQTALITSGVLLLAGCGAFAGTNPHDMSAAEHAARAREEQQVARDHQGMPTVSFSNNCRGGGVPEAGNPICWTANEHRGEAAHHRELAQKHRAAAAALVAAEERMCVGVSEDDRAMSPFYHRADVLRVTPLQTSGDFHGAPAVAGAAVLFRPVPGLTGQSLQHLIDCHLARAAALGHEVPEMPYCPLVLNGVKARVASTDEGLLVELSAEDEATGREILRRSVALLDRGSTPVPSVEGL